MGMQRRSKRQSAKNASTQNTGTIFCSRLQSLSFEDGVHEALLIISKLSMNAAISTRKIDMKYIASDKKLDDLHKA